MTMWLRENPIVCVRRIANVLAGKCHGEGFDLFTQNAKASVSTGIDGAIYVAAPHVSPTILTCIFDSIHADCMQSCEVMSIEGNIF